MLEKKYNLIQILRGFAAVVVMLYHATRHYQEKNLVFLNGIFQHGYFGVDIFFVLSGFVIYYSSQKYLDSGDYLEYIKKRFIRIYPSFWIFLLLPLTIVFFVAPQYIANQSAFKLTENLKIFVLLFDHPTISQVTWTLSFELYFYILFFLIIFNKNFKYLIFFIILLTILNLVNINLFEKSYFQKYLISPLILEFFLGVAIVFISNNVVKKNVVGVSFLLILSIFFFIYIDYLSNNNLIVINKHNRVLSFGLASFLLILSLVLLEKFNAIKSPKTLIIIGDSSYVLYLIHSVILSFLDNQIILSGKFVIINQQISTILACCFIIILSVIIHLLVEKPMIKCLNNSYIKAVS